MSLITRRNFALMAAFSGLKRVLVNESPEAHAAPLPQAKGPRPTHVRNRRLFDLQGGIVRLDTWERGHLHECRDCQDVLYVFMTQPKA
jgi:hypothetical protein